MKKWRVWALLLGLAVILAGCGIKTSTNEDKQPDKPGEFVYGPEVRIAEIAAAEAAELKEGEEPRQVALTQELREEFFDLGRLARWDFMPEFGYDGVAASEDMGDYIYWISDQEAIWENYWSIDHDNSNFKLSTEYVDEFMQVHFGFTVPHWTERQKEMEFDGQNYLPYGDCPYMPLYRLESLTVAKENIDGQLRVVYEASLREYSYWPYDLPEGAEELADVIGESKELLCGDEEQELPEGFSNRWEQQVRFYLDEQNRIRYLGARSIGDL